MSFKANPQGIREFGAQIGGLTDDSGAAVTYVHSWLGIGYAEGRMFATVVEAATNAREKLTANYQRLGALTTASATELDKAARHYETTDRAAAERLDRTY
ncbi:type VII secretion target [Krasilnikovia sp. M28-CT-15]|uniref:type VII secretion target n=1 Tax=Krasilnikovia sp. M28-CT-15 TaxID=3373540 RepID=UPI00387648CF